MHVLDTPQEEKTNGHRKGPHALNLLSFLERKINWHGPSLTLQSLTFHDSQFFIVINN